MHLNAEQVAANFPPLLLAAIKLASTISYGGHYKRKMGQGDDFWQLRRYEFGDPTSLIDWRQSARSQNMFVRENEWEVAQEMWLWRDGSKSMEFKSSRKLPSKIDRANLIILAMASLFVRGGEQIAVMDMAFKPSKSREALSRICSIIDRADILSNSVPKKQYIPKYSHVFWIGDFLTSLDKTKEIVEYYAANGVQGCLLQVLDPAELSLPFNGRIIFGGMESKENDVLIREVDSVRQDYQHEIKKHNDRLQTIFHSVGWGFFSHRTDEKAETALKDLYVYFSSLNGN